MRITSVAGTDLFGGTAGHPLQIVRVTVLDDRPPQPGPGSAPVTVRVEGPGVSTPVPVRLDLGPPGAEQVAEVGVDIAAPAAPGSPRRVTAIAERLPLAGSPPLAGTT
jgi:hypothetical protein